MRGDYLIAGIILIALGFLQLWANGRWPFRAQVAEDGDPSPAAEAKPASGGLWRSWTNVAGYVALGLGVVAIVLAALRG